MFCSSLSIGYVTSRVQSSAINHQSLSLFIFRLDTPPGSTRKSDSKTLTHTYSDERLIEAVESQVPDEPPADKRWNEPQVEVGDHQERSAAHHPVSGREAKVQPETKTTTMSTTTFRPMLSHSGSLERLRYVILIGM